MKISVVIPTLNAGKELEILLTKLEEQTQTPDEILIIDSASRDNTLQIAGQHRIAKTYMIPQEQFSHGGTRDLAFSQTAGEIVVFMSQDAIPVSDTLLEQLVEPLRDEKTVASYARQFPKPEASSRERLIRQFNYPAKNELHSKNYIPIRGIKTFFLSDVCAAYRREKYEELGGFEKDVVSNEDMLYAAKAIQKGYSIAYAAKAEVYHSHDLSLKEQYKRNRLQGYEIEKHKELLENTSSSTEGFAMFRYVSIGLLKQGKIFSIPGLVFDCAARYLGNRAGRRMYRKETEKKASPKGHFPEN